MNVSHIAAYQAASAVEDLLDSSDAASALTGAASIAKTGRSTISADTTANPVDYNAATITSDLTALLKSLATGDLAGAKNGLITLKTDVTQSEPTPSTDSASPASPLDKLVSRLSEALDAGNTSDAFGNVVKYLVSTGNQSGNLLDTAA